jgi:hypothetical protein
MSPCRNPQQALMRPVRGPAGSIDETLLWAALKKTCRNLAEGGIVGACLKGSGGNKAINKNGKTGET